MIDRMESSLARMKEAYTKGVGARDLLQNQKDDQKKALVRIVETIILYEQTQILLTKTSEYARMQLKSRIEETVTAAIQATYNDGTRFEIKMYTQSASNGEQPAAKGIVYTPCGENDTTPTDPEDEDAGGLVDVVSLSSRMAITEMARPPVRGPVIYDEPGKMLSKEYLEPIASIIKKYLQQTKRQGLMVTHHDYFAESADKAYRFSKNGLGESVVNEVG